MWLYPRSRTHISLWDVLGSRKTKGCTDEEKEETVSAFISWHDSGVHVNTTLITFFFFLPNPTAKQPHFILDSTHADKWADLFQVPQTVTEGWGQATETPDEFQAPLIPPTKSNLRTRWERNSADLAEFWPTKSGWGKIGESVPSTNLSPHS